MKKVFEINDTIIFKHVGSKVTGKVIEKNPTGYSTTYLYRAIGSDGTKYLIKKDDFHESDDTIA